MEPAKKIQESSAAEQPLSLNRNEIMQLASEPGLNIAFSEGSKAKLVDVRDRDGFVVLKSEGDNLQAYRVPAEEIFALNPGLQEKIGEEVNIDFVISSAREQATSVLEDFRKKEEVSAEVEESMQEIHKMQDERVIKESNAVELAQRKGIDIQFKDRIGEAKKGKLVDISNKGTYTVLSLAGDGKTVSLNKVDAAKIFAANEGLKEKIGENTDIAAVTAGEYHTSFLEDAENADELQVSLAEITAMSAEAAIAQKDEEAAKAEAGKSEVDEAMAEVIALHKETVEKQAADDQTKAA
ncbi:MAG: hypothetical protein OEY44_00975 [Candidatus Peregrinibacteria bacterium]|nr:hypothetical protein [Candidatus Peregrinibacteria bacterium]